MALVFIFYATVRSLRQVYLFCIEDRCNPQKIVNFYKNQVLFHILAKVQEIIDAKSVFNEYTDYSRVYLQIGCHTLNHQVCSFSQAICPFEIPFSIFVNFRQNYLFYCRYEIKKVKKYIFLENGVCSTEEQRRELFLYW